MIGWSIQYILVQLTLQIIRWKIEMEQKIINNLQDTNEYQIEMDGGWLVALWELGENGNELLYEVDLILLRQEVE